MVRFTKASLKQRVYEVNKEYRTDKYYQYIKSERWKKKKKKLIKKWECEICRYKNRRNLNVHHLTYKNLFKEKKEDLMVLCNICHEIWHTIKKPTKKKVWRIMQANKFEYELDQNLDFLLEK